jgi:retron-type reverse transcriptase
MHSTGAPVAGVTRPTVDGRDASPVSAIEANSAVPALKFDGSRVTRSERGTPQGAVISPILANVYLHYVYDLWTHRWRRKATGDVIVIRWQKVAEIAHFTTVARLICRAAFRGMAVDQFLASKIYPIGFKQPDWRYSSRPILSCQQRAIAASETGRR